MPRPVNRKTKTANPIDAFVSAQLEVKKLNFAPVADRRAFIRRLYVVMHGLPPTPEEVKQFVNDTTPDAAEKLVESRPMVIASVLNWRTR